jgi:carboxyl-terminal processing protease
MDMTLDRATIDAMISKVIHLMETKSISLNGTHPDWKALFSGALDEIRRSGTQKEFEARISRVLALGGLSHVAFFHETGQRAPARYAINATFLATDEAPTRWMFQDVHEGGPAYRAGVRPGDILLEVDGQSVRPPTLPTFNLGIDCEFTIEGRGGHIHKTPMVLPKADPSRRNGGKPPMAEPTSVTARMLPGGIGYVRVAFFPGANGQRFARELDRALATLPDCDRLLIDLRGNLGGFVGSLRLMSYLTPDRLPIGYSLTRKGQVRGLRPEQLTCLDRLPSTKFEMLKMAFRFRIVHRDRSVRLMTEGLGPKPFHGHIVMLVNEHTSSAGEMVAAFAAENKLATLIGVRTAGQVLGGANFPVGHGFILRLPAAGWYTWTGSIVEGRGISPDIEAQASKLRVGEDNQLEAAVSAAGSAAHV